jgi:hypothetical protein
MSICKGEEMKEFEKWWKAYAFNRFLLPDNCAKAGWKAALEWVLSIDSGFCNCGMITTEADDNEIFISNLTQIKQELEK